MRTKLDAARIATAPASPSCSPRPTGRARRWPAEQVGTWFQAATRRRPTRQLWLAHATEPKGVLLLDEGAVRAVVERRASLLAAGLTGATGSFWPATRSTSPAPTAWPSRAGWSTSTPTRSRDWSGKTSATLRRELGAAYEREVVHRDDLALL